MRLATTCNDSNILSDSVSSLKLVRTTLYKYDYYIAQRMSKAFYFAAVLDFFANRPLIFHITHTSPIKSTVYQRSDPMSGTQDSLRHSTKFHRGERKVQNLASIFDRSRL